MTSRRAAADRYPAAALQRVREHAESEAERAFAEALERAGEADLEVDRAREALRRHRSAERERAARELERDGRCLGVELRRGLAYAERQTEREGRLAHALSQARQDRSEAQRALQVARGRLADAAIERRIAERHRERWERARATQRERRDEAALEAERDARSAWQRGRPE